MRGNCHHSRPHGGFCARAVTALAGGLTAVGCSGFQSSLAPAGPQASRIAQLWWAFFWVAAIVWVLVLAFLLAGVWRAREKRRQAPSEDPSTQARLAVGVGIAVAVTVVVLFGLLVASVATGRAVASLGSAHAVTIDITGHQFWWEVEYSDPVPDRRVTTANEIHIPTGQPVVLNLTSSDVIHSFWVPNLHGKRDLIPGYVTSFWIQADRPGVYRGQCAEFCGADHALMALDVVAEPPAKFREWLVEQRKPAPEPAADDTRRGQQVFLAAPCVQCHRVGGTTANGSVAPDLTHLASRRTIAAGTLPNTSGNLAGWILDPQSVKPGNHMPPNALRGEDLQALLAYLRSLK